MQTKSIDYPGNSFVTDASVSLTAPTYSTTVYSNGLTRSFRVLIAGVTNGDRKSPYPIRYDLSIIDKFRGVYTLFQPNGVNYVEYRGVHGATVPDVTSGVEHTDLAPSEVYNQALSRVYARLRSEIDWSINAVQSREVKALVKSASKYIDYARQLRKGDLKRMWRDFQKSVQYPFGEPAPKGKGKPGTIRTKGKSVITRPGEDRAIKRLGGKWLAFHYGLKPLAQDIWNSVNELNSTFQTDLRIIESAKGPIARRGTTSIAYFNRNATYAVAGDYRVRFDLRYKPRPSTLNLISNFTSVNPASIAWELMPWSFVVDWFYDVGGYLRNLESALLSQQAFKSGYYTDTMGYDCEFTIADGPGVSAVGNKTLTAGLSASRRYCHKRRTVLTSTPFPRLPRIKADLGTTRMLNAAALLSQFMGKKPREAPVFDPRKPVSYFNWGPGHHP